MDLADLVAVEAGLEGVIGNIKRLQQKRTFACKGFRIEVGQGEYLDARDNAHLYGFSLWIDEGFRSAKFMGGMGGFPTQEGAYVHALGAVDMIEAGRCPNDFFLPDMAVSLKEFVEPHREKAFT